MYSIDGGRRPVRLGEWRDAEPVRLTGSAWDIPVDYSPRIPLGYWKQGAPVIPTAARDRVMQLQEYQRLYAGIYDRYYAEPLIAKFNYHQLIAQATSDFLMQFPPEYEGADALLPTFLRTLNAALASALVDAVTYGTGLLHIINTAAGPRVQSLNPIYWFPASDTESTYLVPAEDDLQDSVHVTYQYHADGAIVASVWANSGGQLGSLVARTEVRVGDAASWAYIAGQSPTRFGAIIPIVRPRERSDDWGTSLFETITHDILELNRRYNNNSILLTEHGNPIMVTTQSADGQGADDIKGYYRATGDGAGPAVHALTAVRRYADARRNPVLPLPEGADAFYLESQGNMEDPRIQIELVLSRLYTASGLPSAYFGVDDSMRIPASGEALRLRNLASWNKTQVLQAHIENSLPAALLSGAVYHGLGSPLIRELSSALSVTWRNIYDELDAPANVTIDGGAAETAPERPRLDSDA